MAKFYDAAFGLKEIDRVGNPATKIIMRFGDTVAEAKAGALIVVPFRQKVRR